MARKEIIIIGAGMGGLAAGICPQAGSYRGRIFESHSVRELCKQDGRRFVAPC